MRGIAPAFRIWESLSNCIERFLTSFGVILLVGMWVLLLINAVNDWLETDWTSTWTMEIVGWMVAWSIFMLMGPVAKWDMHIKVTFFPNKLLGEARGRAYLRMLENLAGLAVCTFLSLHAMRWVINSYDMAYKQESVGGWEYPLWTLRLGIFIGFTSIAFFYFDRMIKWAVSRVASKEQVGLPETGAATQSE